MTKINKFFGDYINSYLKYVDINSICSMFQKAIKGVIMKNKTFILYALSCVGLLSLCDEPKISEWHHVAVRSRSTTNIPYNAWTTETEVHLRFSDGTSWEGTESRVRPSEEFLMHAHVGDSIWYRYNSTYFTGKQWSR